MDYEFEDLGEHHVKNIPVRVFRVCFDPDGIAELPQGGSSASNEGVLLAIDQGPPVAAIADAVELAFWQSVQASDDPSEYQAYLAQYLKGDFAALAQARLANPSASEQSSSEDRAIELEFWNSIKDTELRAMFKISGWRVQDFGRDPRVAQAPFVCCCCLGLSWLYCRRDPSFDIAILVAAFVPDFQSIVWLEVGTVLLFERFC